MGQQLDNHPLNLRASGNLDKTNLVLTTGDGGEGRSRLISLIQ